MQFLILDIRTGCHPWVPMDCHVWTTSQLVKSKVHTNCLPIILHSTPPWLQPCKPTELQMSQEEIAAQLTTKCMLRGAATKLAIAVEKQPKQVVLSDEYKQFASVLSKDEAQWFPLAHLWDHTIDFKKGVPDAIDCKIYPMTPTENRALDEFIDEQLAKGYIWPSISPYVSSFFFIKKKDGKLHPVQDYWNINKLTECLQYPIPLITALIRDLGGASIYTKLDIWWGYNNLHIKVGDEHKAAFKMQCSLYKPTGMSFGLTNLPSMFQAMMNAIYCTTIFKYKACGMTIHIYMDDIAIATMTPSLPSHITTVTDVLCVTWDNSPFISKCTFHASSIDCPGVILEKGVTHMDPVKVASICGWPTPNYVKDVHISMAFTIFIIPLLQDAPKLHCLSTCWQRKAVNSHGQTWHNAHLMH